MPDNTQANTIANSVCLYTSVLNFIRKRFAHKLEAAYTAKDGALPNSKPYAGFEAFMGVLQRADPTASKRYLPWLTLQYTCGHFYANQDTGVIRAALTVFHKNKHQMTVGKDISQHRSLSDLYRFIAQFEEQASIPEGLPKALHDAGEATLIHYSADTMIIVPHTESASQQLGSGTKWCTAARDDCKFSVYNFNGPLIIIKHKGHKYQIHYEIGDFMDERDKKVDGATRLLLLEESYGIKKLHQHKLDAGYADIFNSLMSAKHDNGVSVTRKLAGHSGGVQYRNAYGELHSPNSNTPAITHSDESKEWRKNGKLHRDNDLPAKVHKNEQQWYIDGRLHRGNDLPAIITEDGGKHWYQFGMLQRNNDRPSIILADGCQFFTKNSIRHRDNDLPAVIRPDNCKEWWINGKLHRDNDLPAVIRSDGRMEWRQNGLLHRDNDLPAVISASGYPDFYKNGNRYVPDEQKTKIKWHQIGSR